MGGGSGSKAGADAGTGSGAGSGLGSCLAAVALPVRLASSRAMVASRRAILLLEVTESTRAIMGITIAPRRSAITKRIRNRLKRSIRRETIP